MVCRKLNLEKFLKPALIQNELNQEVDEEENDSDNLKESDF